MITSSKNSKDVTNLILLSMMEQRSNILTDRCFHTYLYYHSFFLYSFLLFLLLAPERKLKMLQSHIVRYNGTKTSKFSFFLTLQEPQGIKNAQPDLENGGKLITTFVLIFKSTKKRDWLYQDGLVWVDTSADCCMKRWFGLVDCSVCVGTRERPVRNVEQIRGI